jgi:hypothetical protein
MNSEKGELPTWRAPGHTPSDKGGANPTPELHGPRLEADDAQSVRLGAAFFTQTAPPKPEPKQDEIPKDEVPKPGSTTWIPIEPGVDYFSHPDNTSQPVAEPVPAIIESNSLPTTHVPNPQAERAPDVFDFELPNDGVTTTTPKRDGPSPASTRDIQGSRQWNVPAPTAIAYVPAPHPGEEATPNRYPDLVPQQKEGERDSDTNPASTSVPANTPTSTQSQPTSQATPNKPPQRLGTLSEIMLSGATVGVAGVAAGIGERGLVGGALGGVSIALLTGFAQESWDKLSAKGRAVTSGLGSLATAIYLSDDLSISKLGVAVAASTVVAAGVVTASKIKEKLTPPQIETSNTDYLDKVDEQVDAAVEALNKQEPGSGDKWKQDSEDNGSLVRLTNYACDLHQTKGSIPQNLIKSFNNSPQERAFRAGKKIQEVMKWGKQQLTQPSAALKIGGLALITGEATAIASDKLNTLQATAFATIVGGAIYGGSKAKESYDKLDKTDKLLVKIIGGSACILAGTVGFAVWSKLGQSAPSKPKGTKATRIIHQATTSTSALKPKSQSTTVAEFIPKGSGSGSSAGEFIPTPTGRTATTATTKATEVATTVATELKPGAETTQRTAKAAEKSGQALQKGQELKFKVGMATEEEKLKRRIKTLSKGRKVLSDSEITNKAKKILTKRWKILNGPGAAENLPKLTPSVASRIGDNEILRELTTAA